MSLEKQLLILSEDIYELPNPQLALDDPEGLSAIGGDLTTERLIHLYQHGFFPWYSDADPILWWHPAQRCQLLPYEFHLSKSLKKHTKRFSGSIKINTAFHETIQYCRQQRQEMEGTWISNDIQQAFTLLHKLGFAHSIEVWKDESLIGGLYGIALGEFFFGESMFSLEANASKLALHSLCLNADILGIKYIDCQVESDHLMSLGARLIPRNDFIQQLKQAIPTKCKNTELLKIDQLNFKVE
ncbi:Leucyltransferase [Marinomonas sp. MED121]|uniref:leucyl/phenylalanyl-tRNA--protein transferase n=1 Tax=Marinomonas sp. MED121 TaxID=314277 RepID=UPI000068FBFA|nr:leucyl/phenylalanyl-tRNA--protein transferase [Marinomonas sp. MED121]EAQ63817.1 Leucyltransferase [Marinomonas sp. MED121]